MQIDLTEGTVVMGQKNSGKSVAIEHLLTKMRRYIAIDPNHEHGPPNAVIARSPREVLLNWIEGNTRIIIRDAPLTEEKLVQYIRAFGQLKDAYLVVDEAHNWMNYSTYPDGLEDVAKWHLTHNNCGLVLGVHQAKEVHDKIWTHIDNYLIFPYGDHEDSKFASLNIPRSAKTKIMEMDPNSYQFLWYKDVAGASPKVSGPVPIPDHLS